MASKAVGIEEPVRFGGGYVLELRPLRLLHGSKVLKLERIPLEILALLLEKNGEVVKREEIAFRVWGQGVFLDTDNSIRGAIRKLRHALQDDAESPQFIETVTGHGYRFVAPLDVPVAATDPRPPSQPANSGHDFRLWLLAAIVSLGLLTYLWYFHPVPPSKSRPPGGPRRLAVLPFQNLSGNPDQEYFSDGTTEEIIARLTQVAPSQLAVIARTSAMAYKGTTKTVAEIGSELDVDYILEGSVRRDSGRVRITAQLIKVRDQSHVWAESYERELSSILTVQKEIAADVSREVGLKITDDSSSAPKPVPAVRADAYEEYLQGLYLWHKGGQQTYESLPHFQRAVALQPDYAPAYAWLAFAYNILGSGEILPPSEAYPLAKAAALKAIEMDPSLPDGHAALGFVLRNYEWDWQQSESELHKAVLAAPDNPTARQVYALLLSTLGRHDEAIAAIKRTAERDPLSPIVASNRAMIYANAREYTEATKVWESHRKSGGQSFVWWGHFLLAQGASREALAEFESNPPGSPVPSKLAGRAQALAAMGRTAEARALLKRLEAQPLAHSILSPYIARAHAALGDTDEAFRWLQIALDERAARLIFLKVDPAWDSMRSDPRFQTALQRMNLAQ